MSNESPTVKVELDKERIRIDGTKTDGKLVLDQPDKLDPRVLPYHWQMRLRLTEILHEQYPNASADQIAELSCAIAGRPYVRTFRTEIYRNGDVDVDSIP